MKLYTIDDYNEDEKKRRKKESLYTVDDFNEEQKESNQKSIADFVDNPNSDKPFTIDDYQKAERSYLNSDFDMAGWFKNASDVISSVQGKSSDDYKFAKKSSDYNAQANSLLSDDKAAESYIESLKGTKQYDTFKNEYNNYKAQLQEVEKFTKSISNFASQYKSEDDYTTALKGVKRAQKYGALKSYADYMNAVDEADNDDDRAWLTAKGEDIASADDIYKRIEQLQHRREQSEPVSLSTPGYYNYSLPGGQTNDNPGEREKFNKVLNDSNEIERLRKLAESKKAKENINKYYYDVPLDEKDIIYQYKDLRYGDFDIKNGEYSDETKAMLGEDNIKKIEAAKKLAAKKGYNLDEWAKWYQRGEEDDEAEIERQRTKDYANDYPFAASIKSIVENPIRAISTADRYAREASSPRDENDPYVNPKTTDIQAVSDIRETVSKGIDNPVGSFLYNTGISMADFVMLLPLNEIPGGQALSMSILGTEAGTQSANDALERGSTFEQALSTGVASGIAEALFEKLSIDQLNAFKLSGKGSLKDIVKNIFKGMATEGSEEGATDIANMISDRLINGDTSEFETNKKNYILQGYSEDESDRMAWQDFGNQFLQDIAGGALSGGVLNAAAGGINAVSNKLDPTSENSSIADYYTDKLNSIENDDLSELDETLPSTATAKTSEGASYKLNDKEKKIAKKLTTGENLTADEADIISSSASLQKLINSIPESDTANHANYIKALSSVDTKISKPDMVSYKETDTSGMETSQALQKTAKAQGFNSDTTQAFIDNYDGEMSIPEYTQQFLNYHNLGRTLSPYNTLNPNSYTIANNVRYAAYESGKNIYVANAKLDNMLTEAQQRWKNESKGYKTGTVDTSKIEEVQLTQNQKDSVKYISRYSKVGLNIEFYQSSPNAKGRYTSPNGWYNSATHTIGIDINAGRASINEALKNGAMLSTFSHELTHIAEHAPEEYTALREAVMNTVGAEAWEEAVSKQYNNLKNNHSEQYKNMSDEQIREAAAKEALAESCSDMLKKADVLEQMIEENPKYTERFINFIKKVVKALRNLRTRILQDSTIAKEEAKLLEEKADDLQAIIDKYSAAVKEGIKNQNARTAVKSDTEQSGKVNNHKEQFELRNDINGNTFVDVDSSIYDNTDGASIASVIAKIIKTRFNNILTANGQIIRINATTNAEWRRSEYATKLMKQKPQIYKDKMRAISNADEILVAAKNWIGEQKQHKSNNKFVEFARGNVYYRVGDNGYVADVIVGTTAVNSSVLYDLVNIYKTKIAEAPVSKANKNHLSSQHTSTKNSIPQNSENINKNTAQKSNEDFVQRQDRNLVAVHNLNANELEKSLELGGLAMPSIAVVKDDFAHTEYGDVSVLFSRDTIDPEVNRDNKVYGGDAWTPTYPSLEYKLNSKKSQSIYRKINKIGQIPFFNPSNFHPVNLEDTVNRLGNETLVEKYKKDYGLKNAFLKDTTGEYVKIGKKETVTRLSDEDISEYTYLADKMPKDMFEDIKRMDGRDWMKKYRDKFEEIRSEYIKTAFPEITDEELENIFISEKGFRVVQKARKIYNFIENGAETKTTYNDIEGAEAEIDRKVNDNEYEKWLNELFDGVIEKSGIYNGKDPYTSYGNKKSFEQLHYEETLENVVKVMKQQANGEGALFSGLGLWGVAAKNYGTIEELKQDENRLQTMDEEEYSKIKNQFGERFTEIAASIVEHREGQNEFIEMDNAFENILDAVRNCKTKSGMLRELRSYYSKTTNATIDDILDLIADVGNMPTEYFEAKPQRAVGLDEIKAVVLPDNASDTLKSKLKENNIPFFEYKAGDNESRKTVTQQAYDTEYTDVKGEKHTDIRFQDRNYMNAVDNGDTESAQRMVDEAAKAAGYDTPKLYHGTQKFGFTEFDLDKMDDGSSIFLTSTEETASTYSAYNGVREIKNRINVDKLSGDELASAANLWSIIKNSKLRFKYYTIDDFNKILKTINSNSRVYKEYEWLYINDDIQDGVLLSFTRSDKPFFVYSQKTIREELKDVTELHSGNYALYAKLDNPLVIEANGMSWQHIPVPHDIWKNLSNPNQKVLRNGQEVSNTRAVATYAKENNYDGVIYKNLLDNGGKKPGANGMSDVYVVFDSAQVKSADAVTYDDNGNVIPLSERFNSEQKDIRYQDREHLTTEDELIEKATHSPIDFELDDDLFEEEEQDIDFDNMISDDPQLAMELMYKQLAKQSHEVVRFGRDKALKDIAYRRIANKIINDYSIERSHLEELTEKVKQFIENNTEASFADDFKNFVLDMRQSLLYSNVLDENRDKRRRAVRDTVKGQTLIIPESAEAEIRSEYESVRNYANILLGYGITVSLRNNTGFMTKTNYSTVNDIITDIQEQTGEMINNDTDGEDAYIELERFLNDSLSPKYNNPYLDGILENIDIAAVEVASDVMTEYTHQLGLVTTHIDSKQTKKLNNQLDIIKAQRDKLLRAAKESSKLNNDLTKYKKRLDTLQADTDKLDEVNWLIEANNEDETLLDQRAELENKVEEDRKALMRLKTTRPIQKVVDRQIKRAVQAERDKQREIIKRNRSRYAEELNELKDKNYNKLNEYRNARKLSEVVDNIGVLQRKMARALRNPTENVYVPEAFSTVYIDVCDAITEALNNGKVTQVNVKLLQLQSELRKLNDSKEEYEGETEFKGEISEQLFNNLEYVVQLAQLLDNRLEQLDGRPITKKTISLREANNIYNVLFEIYHTVQDATKQLGRKDKRTNFESGAQIDEDMKGAKKFADKTKLENYKDKFKSNVLNGIRLSRYYSGYNDNSEIMYHVNALNEGQRKANVYKMNAEKKFLELTEKRKKDYKRSLSEVVEVKYKLNNGEDASVKLTRMTALQALMTWTREQTSSNLVHMERSGMVLPDADLMAKGKIKEALEKSTRVDRVNTSLVVALENTLTDFEQEYRKIAEDYFNHYSKAAINEVSNIIKHRSIAMSEYYIPMTVAKNYIAKELESLKYDASIEGMGMLKSTNTKAPQPLIMTSLNNVISRHINDISKYYGLAIPTRNFKKALNVSFTDVNENGDKIKTGSVRDTIKSVWGYRANDFFDRLIADLESSRNKDNNATKDIQKAIGGLRKAMVIKTLTGNISVVIKQAASYPTAGLYLNTSSLMKELAKAANLVKPGNYQKLIDEIDEHTAQHYMRRLGMSQPEINEFLNSWARNIPTALNPAKWIQGVDCLTTALLWNATKEDVKSQYKKSGKAVNTDEYWKDVTDLYDKVIEDTQPMYDSLHRSELQKNTNEVWKSVFMFKTQPLQNTGIIYDSIGYAIAHPKDKAAFKTATKAVTSQVVSLSVFAGMSFAAALLLNRLRRYKDDDGDLTFESVMKTIFHDMLINGAGVFEPLFGNEIAEFIESTITKKGRYDTFSMPVVDMLNDTISAIQTTYDEIVKDVDRGKYGVPINTEKLFQTFKDDLIEVTGLFGIPAQNISNLLNAFLSRVGINILAQQDNRRARDYIKSYGNNYLKGNTEKAKEQLKTLYKQEYDKNILKGKERDEAHKAAFSSVRSKLSSTYKLEYQKAFLGGDDKTQTDITNILSKSGYMVFTTNKTLPDVLSDWRENAKKDVNNSYNK